MENFLQTVQPWRVVSNREDRLFLKGSNSGIYSVKLMYEALNRPASESTPFPALSVWNPLAPLKVGIFLGGIFGKGVDTGSNQKKGKTLSKHMLPL